MIVIFDDVNVYTPTLMTYGTIWSWLSALAIMAIFSSEVGIGIERATRAGWLMKPYVYTKEAFEQTTYSKDAFDMKTYTGE